MTKHEETMKKLKEIQESIDALVETLGGQVKHEEEPADRMRCPAHPEEFAYLRNGRYGTFYSHGMEIGPDRWVYCNNGGGYQMKKTDVPQK